MPIEPVLLTKIKQLSQQLQPELVCLRRGLHQQPELSGQEEQTANTLINALQVCGVQVERCLSGFGFAALVHGREPGRVAALRVDIDALPIQETNQHTFVSQRPGVMHACGHDLHSAIGVGVAKVLASLRDQFEGTVLIIFQAEEEEITGALKIIRSGLLDHPKPEALFGLHVCPLPAGKLGYREGLFLSGFEHYLVKLRDQQKGDDLARLEQVAESCCQAINALNTLDLPQDEQEEAATWQGMLDGRPELQDFVVYAASTAEEDEPEYRGQLGLGIKASSRALRRAAKKTVKETLDEVCHPLQVNFVMREMGSMPDVINDRQLVRQSLPALRAVISEEDFLEIKAGYPFNCEDFAFYLKHLPGAMFWLGAANPERGMHARLHTSNFDVDEGCIAVGVRAMSAVLLDVLSKPSKKVQAGIQAVCYSAK